MNPARLLKVGVAVDPVDPVGECGTVQHGWLFVEYLPHKLRDVVVKAKAAVRAIDDGNAGSLVNHPAAHQSLHDTIIEAQGLGARLLRYVEPEQLLFIFGESIQSLKHAVFEVPFGLGFPGYLPQPGSGEQYEQDAAAQKTKAYNGAVIISVTSDAKRLKQWPGRKKQDGANECDCHYVTWTELEGIKQWLQEVGEHPRSLVEGGAA